MNKFTKRAERVLRLAEEEARRLNHDYVSTKHILLGLIALGEGVAANVLASLGIDLRKVRAKVEKIAGAGDSVMLSDEIPFLASTKEVLEYAEEEARHMGHPHIGTEHLLLGLLRNEEGTAAQVLGREGKEMNLYRKLVLQEFKKPETKPLPLSAVQYLIYELLLTKPAPEVQRLLREAQLKTKTTQPKSTDSCPLQSLARELAKDFLTKT